MKRTGLIALLALVAAPAQADINPGLLEYYKGKLDATQSEPGAQSEDGDVQGVAAVLPIGRTSFVRADWRKEEYGFEFDWGASADSHREIQSLTIGLVDMMNREVRFIGEIGAVRMERGFIGFGVDDVATANSPLFRLGVAADDGNFSWSLTGEWLTKALQPDLSRDNERWWNFFFGYTIAGRVTVGVTYADYEDYKQTGAGVRFRF